MKRIQLEADGYTIDVRGGKATLTITDPNTTAEIAAAMMKAVEAREGKAPQALTDLADALDIAATAHASV